MPASAHTTVAPEASGWSSFPSTHQPSIYRAFEHEHPVLTSSPLPAFRSLAIRVLYPGFWPHHFPSVVKSNSVGFLMSSQEKQRG